MLTLAMKWLDYHYGRSSDEILYFGLFMLDIVGAGLTAVVLKELLI